MDKNLMCSHCQSDLCQTGYEFVSPLHPTSLVLCSQCRSTYLIHRRIDVIGQESVFLQPFNLSDLQKKMMIDQLKQRGLNVNSDLPQKRSEQKAGLSKRDAAKLKIAIAQAETVKQFLDSVKENKEE